MIPVSIPATMRIEPAARHSLMWVRGPVWDGVWMLNALWLLPLVLWLVRGNGTLDILYFGLTALFWIGHRLSSTWLAYCTEAYRPLLRIERTRFVVVPLLVTVTCFAVFLPADRALPWSREERLVGMAILDYALVTYHFAAQHFGALSLYRTRAKRTGCSQTRRLDRLFSFGVGGALVFFADILAGSVAYQDLWPIPAWLASNQGLIRQVALLMLLIVTAFILMSEARAPCRSLPRILYVLGLAAMVAVALQPRPPFLFLVIWTAQHWILAVGLACQTASGASAPARGTVRSVLRAINSRPWAVRLVLVAASVLMLPFFEVEANRQGGRYYGDWIFDTLPQSLRTSSWLPALVALGFATGFVHYLLDRGVYRMSDPRIRSAARGLLERAPM